jgi:hypothetical protein
MLLRAVNWNCARKQIALSQLKAVYTSPGVLSPNPPPTPWWFEYAEPTDCLKCRFVLRLTPQYQISPPLTSGGMNVLPRHFTGFVPFIPALDTDSFGNPIKVILTNEPKAQLVYTADISQVPDLWDSQLQIAASSSLAAYLANTLARNTELMSQMVSSATATIAAARASDGNEGLPTQDHIPDWVQARSGGFGCGPGGVGQNCGGFDGMSFPGGLRY